ncbi:MAG: hypothetical protein U0S36_03225 [Candidatus Nanopelagicales bacterium]
MPDERSGEGRRLEPAAVDAALAVVPGVLSSSIALDDQGAPTAVRIVLEPDADEVEVAAGAHRILRLQFGVGLDPEHVTVVEVSWPEPVLPQPRLHLVDDESRHALEIGGDLAPRLAGIDADDARYGTDVLESAVRHPAGAAASLGDPASAHSEVVVDVSSTTKPDRLVIAHLAVADDGAATSAVVTLLRGRTEHVGMAEGGSTPAELHRTIAQATAYAVAEALAASVELEVQDTSVVPVNALQVVVVQIAWHGPQGEERLLGATEVRDDVRQAVIRATLDAVNRRLALALDPR